MSFVYEYVPQIYLEIQPFFFQVQLYAAFLFGLKLVCMSGYWSLNIQNHESRWNKKGYCYFHDVCMVRTGVLLMRMKVNKIEVASLTNERTTQGNSPWSPYWHFQCGANYNLVLTMALHWLKLVCLYWSYLLSFCFYYHPPKQQL